MEFWQHILYVMKTSEASNRPFYCESKKSSWRAKDEVNIDVAIPDKEWLVRATARWAARLPVDRH